ncbi:MAG: hypothetical protein MI684_01550 [Chlorobiales bacterium]|nr:hypothetical protein [Chlorobiales bacterium]
MMDRFEERGSIDGTLTAIETMQATLFFRPFNRPTPLAIAHLVRNISCAEALVPFTTYLVGSVIYSPENSRDVDLVLTPAGWAEPSIEEIERALLYCIETGINSFDLCIDPVFRNRLVEGPLTHETWISGLKLEDPRMTFIIEAGIAMRFGVRRLGKCLVAINHKVPSISPSVSVGALIPWSSAGNDEWPSIH